jgi:hypothetical protein
MSHSVEEVYSVYNETVRKARKTHSCAACRSPILPRHYYASVFIVFEGKAETVKRCGSCQTTHLHLRELGDKHGMWPDEKLNCGKSYDGEWGEEPPEEIAALPFLSSEERGLLLSNRCTIQL